MTDEEHVAHIREALDTLYDRVEAAMREGLSVSLEVYVNDTNKVTVNATSHVVPAVQAHVARRYLA